MKNPVIKKQTHYNLLLMRDDSEARTFRLHGNLLRFLLYFLILLLLAGSAGIAGGVYYFGKYRALSAKHGEREKELAEVKLQLERLANLESLLAARNGNPLQAKNEEVGASPVAARQQNATARNDSVASRNASMGGLTAILPAGNATAPLLAASAVNATSVASAASSANATAVSGAAQSASKSLESEDSPVRISMFSARAGGPQRLRISYELSTANPEELRTVSGAVRYYAVFANGTRLELPLQDIDGTRFSILRMKPMQNLARLPQGHSTSDIASIDLYVDIADGESFHQTFPFTK
jgi:hypothetical protein